MRFLPILLLTLLIASCGNDSASTAPNAATADASADVGPDALDTEAVSDMGDIETGAQPDATRTPDAGAPDLGPIDKSPLDVMDRPAAVVVPDDYDASRSYPLVVLLHGFSAWADIQDEYFTLGARTTDRDFILVKPNGTMNPEGKRFWNAFWCCDFYQQDIDDVGYISGLIDAAKERFNIDANRVYLIGHSNGGFMSYRMACEVDGIAAIASLAGAAELDEADCLGSGGPVAILQIHGTADITIPYNGWIGRYTSAPELMQRWTARNGCDPDAVDGEALDLEELLPGAETTTETWNNCDEDATVALWTIVAGSHIPKLQPEFIDHVLDFLFAHQSP